LAPWRLSSSVPGESIADSGTPAKGKNNGRFDSSVYQKMHLLEVVQREIFGKKKSILTNSSCPKQLSTLNRSMHICYFIILVLLSTLVFAASAGTEDKASGDHTAAQGCASE
jgi:hypothetical protein